MMSPYPGFQDIKMSILLGKMWKLIWKWDRLINWTDSRKQGQTNKPDREPETGTDQ